MKEWRFVGLCLLLGGLIFFSLNQFAKALQPRMNVLDSNLGGWEIEAMSVEFDALETIDSDNAWALQSSDRLPDSIYRYDGNKWQLEHIFNAEESVTDLDMVSATDGWAAGKAYAGIGSGGAGVLWRYDGHSWNRFATPVEQRIFALDIISSEAGWLLGADALLRFDGVKWEEVGPGLQFSSQNEEHYYLQVFSETEAWVHHYNSVYFYDGTQWEQVSELDGIRDLAMISNTNGWASNGSGGVLHYDGVQWSAVPDIPLINTFTPRLNEFSVVSSENIWVTTSFNHQLLHYMNGEWSIVTLPETVGTPQAISMTEMGGWVASSHGRMAKYTDGTWAMWEGDMKPMYLTRDDLRDVRAVSQDIALIDNPSHFYNGHWESPALHPELANFVTKISQRESVTPISISIDNFDVSPPGEAWAVGSIYYEYPYEFYGTLSDVLFELDGAMWKPITTTRINSYSVFDILSSQSGWAMSPIYGFQHYDGNSWQWYSIQGATLYDMQMLSTESGWAVGSSYRMLGSNEQPNGFSAVLQFDGADWKTIESTPGHGLYAIDMISEIEGWAVGAGGTILHYVDGSWMLEPSPIETHIYDIAMVSSDEGWAISRGIYRENFGPWINRSTILSYDGTSWQIASHLDGFMLNSISVSDSGTGRIVGDDGLILKLSEQAEPTPTPEPTDTVNVIGKNLEHRFYLPVIVQ